MTRLYIIATWVDFDALTELQKTWLIAESREDSLSTVKSSLDGSKLLLKWDGEVNLADLIGLTHTNYTYAQILVEVANEDWLSTVGI